MQFMAISTLLETSCSPTTLGYLAAKMKPTFKMLDFGLRKELRDQGSITFSHQLLQSAIILSGADSMKPKVKIQTLLKNTVKRM